MTEDMERLLVALLKISKENEEFYNSSEKMQNLLKEVGAIALADNHWKISREIRSAIALKAITHGAQPEVVVENMTWKDFEGLIAQILSENNYAYTESFRRRGTATIQGMEIDVIGVKGNSIIVVDAKMWGIRSGKASALMGAVTKQITRTERLAQQLDRLSKKISGMKPGSYSLTPVMVTWLVEEVELYEGVPVVPIFKLNSFLNEIDRFQDFMVNYKGVLGLQLEQSKL
ncbi:MAG: hypothetical protein P1Q69_05780 [Candidatus Thorarchaeota archaeon]|nr:hypothetical protein [Candidatus Thorarchaeota archaeon]